MSSKNVLRLLQAALLGGEKLIGMKSGDALKVLPVTDDVGSIQIGDGTTDMDVKIFLGASTDFVLFDVGNGQVTLDNAELQMGDNDGIEFGDGADVTVEWNGTYLEASCAANAMWNDCPSKLDPNWSSVAYEVFDDFHSYDNTATVGGWTPFEVGTCTDALSDVSPGGSVILTCQATTDDACQQINKTGAAFKLAAGKTLWFEARVKFTGDIAQSEVSLGLVNAGEDLKAVADVLPQDGISFSKQDTAGGAIAFTCSKDGTNTGAVAAVHTIATGVWVVLGFKVDGLTSATPYVNGVAGTAAVATFCDDELLTPYFLVRNGDATTTNILEIDYVRCVQLR